MRANIVPVTTWQATATQLAIANTEVIEYGETGRAHVWWCLLDAQDGEVFRARHEMTEAQYAAWGTDDTYLLTVVAGVHGFTLLS